MDLESYLKVLKAAVDKALDRYLPPEDEDPRIIHKAMRYSVFSGGKRTRPILAIESCRACGGRMKAVLPAACAIEFVHTYSLIHDDLPAMDDDDYRRGKKSCHKVFGEANAILAGDGLLTLAFNTISKGLGAETGLRAVGRLSEAIGTRGMVGGQVIDLEFEGRQKDRKTLSAINRLKTAKLFEVSAGLGAIVAAAGKKELCAMAAYGASLGMAFQITDDLLDGGDYSRTFGAASSRRDASILIARAKKALKVFGARADRLKGIADYVLTRRF